MAQIVEAKVDAAVDKALALHPSSEPRGKENVARALFQHTGSDAGFAIIAATGLNDHVVDAVLIQQIAEEQASRTCPDDRDLRSFNMCDLGGHELNAPRPDGDSHGTDGADNVVRATELHGPNREVGGMVATLRTEVDSTPGDAMGHCCVVR